MHLLIDNKDSRGVAAVSDSKHNRCGFNSNLETVELFSLSCFGQQGKARR